MADPNLSSEPEELPDDDLGAQLLREGRVTHAELAFARSRGGDLAATLADLGVSSPAPAPVFEAPPAPPAPSKTPQRVAAAVAVAVVAAIGWLRAHPEEAPAPDGPGVRPVHVLVDRAVPDLTLQVQAWRYTESAPWLEPATEPGAPPGLRLEPGAYRLQVDAGALGRLWVPLEVEEGAATEAVRVRLPLPPARVPGFRWVAQPEAAGGGFFVSEPIAVNEWVDFVTFHLAPEVGVSDYAAARQVVAELTRKVRLQALSGVENQLFFDAQTEVERFESTLLAHVPGSPERRVRYPLLNRDGPAPLWRPILRGDALALRLDRELWDLDAAPEGGRGPWWIDACCPPPPIPEHAVSLPALHALPVTGLDPEVAAAFARAERAHPRSRRVRERLSDDWVLDLPTVEQLRAVATGGGLRPFVVARTWQEIPEDMGYLRHFKRPEQLRREPELRSPFGVGGFLDGPPREHLRGGGVAVWGAEGIEVEERSKRDLGVGLRVVIELREER